MVSWCCLKPCGVCCTGLSTHSRYAKNTCQVAAGLLVTHLYGKPVKRVGEEQGLQGDDFIAGRQAFFIMGDEQNYFTAGCHLLYIMQ